METTLRRVAVASRQFPKMRPLGMYEHRGPSSRRYKHARGAIQNTFTPRKGRPGPETLNEEANELRKKVNRICSHGDNVTRRLREEFALKPVTGYWVLEDTGSGVWIVSSPKKGKIKFVPDIYDKYGRLWVTKPQSIEQSLESAEAYVGLLESANSFVEDFCTRNGFKPSRPSATASASAAAAAAGQSREAVPEQETAGSGEAPAPVLGSRRLFWWQKKQSEGGRKRSDVTDEEMEALIKKARALLEDSVINRRAKPGWLKSLDIRLAGNKK